VAPTLVMKRDSNVVDIAPGKASPGFHSRRSFVGPERSCPMRPLPGELASPPCGAS